MVDCARWSAVDRFSDMSAAPDRAYDQPMSILRPVSACITAPSQAEGAGFIVRRPFPGRELPHLDPLLMLDEMGPVDYAPGGAKGAPDHPHRGFETVSYLLAGEVAHADSAGHAGKLGPGDVQWMTAGAGVIHREMPSLRIQQEGGRVHGFQLWVNLPRAMKRTAPRYQEIAAASIPEIRSPDGLATVRLIAGTYAGVEAPVKTVSPVIYQHWRFQPGAAFEVPLPQDHNVGVYVFDGSLTVSGVSVQRGQLAVLGAGEAVLLEVPHAASGPAQALILGGRPLGEPIAWGGPFVMNTRAEIEEAFADYRAGRMGRIPPEIVRA